MQKFGDLNTIARGSITGLLYTLVLCAGILTAQDTTGTAIQPLLRANDAIEKAILVKDAAALDTLFGADLLFFHGGGNVDTKTSYVARVPKSNYASRLTDSSKVEVHGTSALLHGSIHVVNGGANPKPPYTIRVVRLFLQRNGRWELVSHRTLQKWEEPVK